MAFIIIALVCLVGFVEESDITQKKRGIIPPNLPAWEDKSSLIELWENPPRAHKEIKLLPQSLLNGFRSRPGSLPEKYRLMDIGAMKKLHKKKRKKGDANGQDGEANPDAKRARNDKEDDRRSNRREKKRKRRDEEPGSA